MLIEENIIEYAPESIKEHIIDKCFNLRTPRGCSVNHIDNAKIIPRR